MSNSRRKRVERKKGTVRNYSSYNNSSEAYAYQPEVIPQPTLPRRKPHIKESSLEKWERRFHRAKLIVAVAIVFFGSIATMMFNASVTEQRIVNTSLERELMALQSQNSTLEAELLDKIDLAYIESEAINRLGMTEPQSYQVAYIDVPKQSYTVQYNSEVEAEEGKLKSVPMVKKVLSKMGIR